MVDRTDQTDTAIDKQYRLGYEQAWREWSSSVSQNAMTRPDFKIKATDIQRMENRLSEMKKR